jgi:two-component system OmpR family sensor kinase
MSFADRNQDPVSMTRRLVVAVTVVITLSWCLAAVFGVLVMQDEFSEIFDSGVRQTAERLVPLVADDLASQTAADAPGRLAQQKGVEQEYLVFQARDHTGKVLLHSHDSSSEPFDAPLVIGFSNTPTQRIYTAGNAEGSLYVQVADAMDHRREALMEGGTALVLPLLLLIPASIFAVMFVIRRTLSAIQGLRGEIGRKDSGNLAPLEAAQLPTELEPIARSVNLLLERLKSALDAEREFTSNSAHELRTPIAGALAQTQRLIAEAPPTLLPRIRQIERSLIHLARLAEKLLQLARAEAGIGVADDVTDLMPVLRIVVHDMKRSPVGVGRIVIRATSEGVRIERPVSPDAFGIVIRNLVENALIHSPKESLVTINIDERGVICFTNDGPTIDRQGLEELTARFARGATQASGSGLGLSIVQRLVKQMNGTLVLHSPVPGSSQGFQAVVDLSTDYTARR